MTHSREWYIQKVAEMTESANEQTLQELIEKLQRLND